MIYVYLGWSECEKKSHFNFYRAFDQVKINIDEDGNQCFVDQSAHPLIDKKELQTLLPN